MPVGGGPVANSILKALFGPKRLKFLSGYLVSVLFVPLAVAADTSSEQLSESKDTGWSLERPMVITSTTESNTYLYVESSDRGIEFTKCEKQSDTADKCAYAAFLPFQADTHGKLLKLIEISEQNTQVVNWTQWGILVVGGAACIYFGYRSGQISSGLLCGAGVTGLAFGGAYALDQFVLEEELTPLDEMAIEAVFEPLMKYEPEVEVTMSLENYLRNIKIVESLLRTYSIN